MAYHSISIKELNAQFGDTKLFFIAPLGITLSLKKNEIKNYKNLLNNQKVEQALNTIKNPFLDNTLRNSNMHQNSKQYPWPLRIYAKLLVFSYNHFFFLLYLLSHLRMGVFENSIVASDYFMTVYPGHQQSRLCLPRSIFAATTSKRFSKHGCMFIGAFLPSTTMHSWIVEDGKTSYRYDHYWIHYTPIAVMT